MGKLIRNGIEYGGGNGTDIYEVTQAQYNALKQSGTLVHNALYVITDAENLNCTAEDVAYDNTSSGLVADDVQSGIDEVVTELATKASVLKFPTGSSIRGALVDTSIKSGLYVANTMSASDNPAGAYVSFTLISKPRDDGIFSTVYAFVQGHLYSCLVGSSVPSSLTFTLLV